MADPEAMAEAAKKGDMAVVRKQLKAGVAVDAKVDERPRCGNGFGQPDQDVQVPGDEGCGHERGGHVGRP